MNFKSIACDYIKGNGIEIGAYTNPLRVNANVTYIDTMTGEERFKNNPHLTEGTNFVTVDIIDNGETLSKVATNTQDFVITSHVIEHFKNPLKALKAWDRVLKTDGIIYLTIPDMRYTFDKDRDETLYQHIQNDYNFDKPKVENESLEVHEHCWKQSGMINMLYNFLLVYNYDIEFMFKSNISTTFVLRKMED